MLARKTDRKPLHLSYYRHFVSYQRIFAPRSLVKLDQRNPLQVPSSKRPALSGALNEEDAGAAEIKEEIRGLETEELKLVQDEIAARMKARAATAATAEGASEGKE